MTAWLNTQKEVLAGVQNSGVMSLRDHDIFLEKKWLCLDFEPLRLVFLEIFLIFIETETLEMRHFQGMLLGYEV